MYRAALLTLTFVVTVTISARAAEPMDNAQRPAPLSAAVALAAKQSVPSLPAWALDQPDRRPALLPALYGTYGVLQALDMYSTRRALAADATELNPVLKSGSRARMMTVKAAAGAATIFFAERAWKKNRVGAVVLMAALNGVTAAIVAHNTRSVIRR